MVPESVSDIMVETESDIDIVINPKFDDEIFESKLPSLEGFVESLLVEETFL